jgi:hypothetical protein
MHEKINPRSLYTTNNTITNNIQGENGDSTSNEKNEKDEKRITISNGKNNMLQQSLSTYQQLL